jgi:hypothetical protein
MGADTADKMKRSFAGVFAVFHIGFTIVKDVVKLFVDLFVQLEKAPEDSSTQRHQSATSLWRSTRRLPRVEPLRDFFVGCKGIIEVPIKLIQKLGGFIGGLFSSIDSRKSSFRYCRRNFRGGMLWPMLVIL